MAIGIPWLTILMALLTFFSQKKSGASGSKALLAAGLVGAGTYFVTHETDWGRTNLGDLDGVVTTPSVPASDDNTVKNPDGTVMTSGGNPVIKPVITNGAPAGSSGSIWDVFKSWGATGTALVLGTGTAAAGGSIMPLIVIGLAIALLK